MNAVADEHGAASEPPRDPFDDAGLLCAGEVAVLEADSEETLLVLLEVVAARRRGHAVDLGPVVCRAGNGVRREGGDRRSNRLVMHIAVFLTVEIESARGR